MTNVRTAVVFAALALFLAPPAFVVDQNAAKPALPPVYRAWLDRDVTYIITRKERDVFLALQTDRERDLFIEAFWKQRDPILGTPENEYKVEHYRRLAYADKFFGRETTRPGWQTDRGRFYILLGPPTDIVSIQGEGTVYPALIWLYDGQDRNGLPPHFELVFFKRGGLGEYVLYSPNGDGPGRLLVNYQGDPFDREGAFLRLQRYDSRLADASLSLIPGDSTFLGQPTLASEQLLSRIQSLPERFVDERYADAWLKYKGLVEVEYSANYVPSDGLISVIRDASGIFFVHYAVELKRLSVLAQGDRYRLIFALNGNLTDARGRVIFQYEKTIPLDFRKDDVDDIQKTSLEVQDMIPLVPGDYTFSLLVKNTVSKEFTTMDGRVSIPEGTPALGLGPLLLGYQRKSATVPAAANKPFKVGTDQISCQAGGVFHAKENLVVFCQVFGLTPELRERARVTSAIVKDGREMISRTKPMKDTDGLNFIEEIPLKSLSPGIYEMRLALADGGSAEIVAKMKQFQITPLADIPRPWIVSRVMPSSDDPEYAYILGGQSAAAGRPADAERYFATAYRKNPSQLKYALAAAETLSGKGDFAGAKAVLAPFLATAGSDDRLLAALAGVHRALGEFREAADMYRKYLSHAGTSVPVLNALGECLSALGNWQEALSVFESSLKLNPGQDDIRRRVNELREKRNPSV